MKKKITICYFFKLDCDCKKKKNIDRGESIPGFKCPVDSIFEETQEFFRALGKYKFFNRYFRFIYDIGLYYLLIHGKSLLREELNFKIFSGRMVRLRGTFIRTHPQIKVRSAPGGYCI